MHTRSNPRAVGKVLRTRDGSSIMVVAGYAEAHPYSVVLVHGNEADVMGHFDDVQEAREAAEEARRDREGPPQNNPYRTEHAARQNSPKGYKSCGRVTIHHDGKPIGLITCSPTGRRAHDTEVQSVRFPVEYWTPAASKKWLRDHGYDDSRFEAAQPDRGGAKRNPGMDVANEILRQLGGNRFIAMTGAKHIMGDENSLVCKLGRFPGVKVQMLRVTLDPDDTYTMEFMAIRNHEAKVLDSVSGVYADSLRRVFEEHTGLRTSL